MRHPVRFHFLFVPLLALVAAVAVASLARAQIDVTGRWYVTFTDLTFSGMTVGTTIQMTQTGASVTTDHLFASGTIDAGTGALHLDGSRICYDPFFQPVSVPIHLDVTVSPDGQTMTGTAIDAVQVTRSCLILTAEVHGVRLLPTCGDLVVDPGEECDAGFSGHACCTAFCTAMPAGTLCYGGGQICASSACDGAGTCANSPVTAGEICRAANGACDTPERCDGVSLDCPPPSSPTEPDADGDGVVDLCDDCVGAPLGAPRMKLGTFSDPSRSDFVHLRAHVALPAGESLPDPRTTWKLVEIRDANGAPVVYAQVPDGDYDRASGYGWTQRGSRWVYRSSVEGFGQVSRMTLAPSRRPGGGIDVRVRTPRTVLGSISPVLPLRLQLIVDGLGPSQQCGQANFAAAPAGGLACASSVDGSVLNCR